MTRPNIARRLVRFASWPIDRAYWHGQCKNRPRIEWAWCGVSHAITHPLLKLAAKIDRESTGGQMAMEGWWG